jgi:hypothetical protein
VKLSTEQKVNGALYLLIGIFGASQAAFGSDEAYKYVNPYVLFWTRTLSGIALAGVSAAKMYLSGQTFNEVAPPQTISSVAPSENQPPTQGETKP